MLDCFQTDLVKYLGIAMGTEKTVELQFAFDIRQVRHECRVVTFYVVFDDTPGGSNVAGKCDEIR